MEGMKGTKDVIVLAVTDFETMERELKHGQNVLSVLSLAGEKATKARSKLAELRGQSGEGAAELLADVDRLLFEVEESARMTSSGGGAAFVSTSEEGFAEDLDRLARGMGAPDFATLQASLEKQDKERKKLH